MPRLYLREAQVTYRRTDIKLPSRRVSDSGVVADVVREHIGSNICESLVVVALDGQNTILGLHEVSRGAVNGCLVKPADVFRYPLIVGAAGCVMAHNHPSGRVEPSSEDIALTKAICSAGYLLGIPVVDHVIVSDTDKYSFLDAGIMPKNE